MPLGIDDTGWFFGGYLPAFENAPYIAQILSEIGWRKAGLSHYACIVIRRKLGQIVVQVMALIFLFFWVLASWNDDPRAQNQSRLFLNQSEGSAAWVHTASNPSYRTSYGHLVPPLPKSRFGIRLVWPGEPATGISFCFGIMEDSKSWPTTQSTNGKNRHFFCYIFSDGERTLIALASKTRWLTVRTSSVLVYVPQKKLQP
jgi:hypothetical protein